MKSRWPVTAGDAKIARGVPPVVGVAHSPGTGSARGLLPHNTIRQAEVAPPGHGPDTSFTRARNDSRAGQLEAEHVTPDLGATGLLHHPVGLVLGHFDERELLQHANVA